MIYMVECGFNDPSRENEWNDHYSGPKLDNVLKVPGFKTSQRFVALDSESCPYLAIHTVESLSILEGQNYKGGGGGNFGTWQSYITDWTRSYYEGSVEAPNVPLGSYLALTDLTSEEIKGFNLNFIWLKAAGLECKSPQRGLAIISVEQKNNLSIQNSNLVRIFEPMVARKIESTNKVTYK